MFSLFVMLSHSVENSVADIALPNRNAKNQDKLSKVAEEVFSFYSLRVKEEVKEGFLAWLEKANVNDYLVIKIPNGHKLVFLLKAGNVGVGSSLTVRTKTVTEVDLKAYNKLDDEGEGIIKDSDDEEDDDQFYDDDDEEDEEFDEDPEEEEEGELEI